VPCRLAQTCRRENRLGAPRPNPIPDANTKMMVTRRNNECIYPRPIFAACVPKRNRLGMIRDHASVGHGRTHGSLMLATTVTFDQVQGWRERSNSVTEIMLVSSMSQVSAN
jgi:hypothetical protein